MVLKTKQTFDKVMLDRYRNPGDFLNYVAMGANRELVDKLVDKLRNHKLYIVRLSEPWTEDEDTYGTMAFRQDLICERVIQCAECKYWNTDGCRKGVGECTWAYYMTKPDDFCSYGEREDE